MNMRQRGIRRNVMTSICIILAVAFFALPAKASLVAGSVYSNNGGSAKNVFTVPDTNSEIIASLPVKKTFDVISISGTWLQIAYYFNAVRFTGWITSDGVGEPDDDGYVSPVMRPDPVTEPPAIQPTQQPPVPATQRPMNTPPQNTIPPQHNGNTSIYGTAIIISPDGQPLTLRESDATISKAMGQYYAGTEVLLNTDPLNE